MLEAIYTRRSVRKYTDEPVSRTIIEQITDAGRVAPSAKNRQPWKYLVYSGEAKDRLLGIMEAAPTVIVVLNTNGKSPFMQLDADDRF